MSLYGIQMSASSSEPSKTTVFTGLGFRVRGLGFRGLGFRVGGLGFRGHEASSRLPFRGLGEGNLIRA